MEGSRMEEAECRMGLGQHVNETTTDVYVDISWTLMEQKSKYHMMHSLFVLMQGGKFP